jgi:hypothetical protein
VIERSRGGRQKHYDPNKIGDPVDIGSLNIVINHARPDSMSAAEEVSPEINASS